MFVVGIDTLTSLGPVFSIASQFPTMQNAEQPITLVPQCPKISAALRINSELNGLEQVRTINRILMIEAILGHHLSTLERTFVAR